jgi:histidinol phosphatase-like enzyme
MVEKYALDSAETWMIGDMPCDVQAGLNAGVRTAMIKADPAATVPAGAWLFRDWVDFEKQLWSENGPSLPAGSSLVPLSHVRD